MTARKGPADRSGGKPADQPCDHRSTQQRQDDRRQRPALARPAQIFIGHDAKQRPDRIIDDRFPFQDGARPRGDVGLTQQGQHHGRTRDHQYPRKQDRDRPDQPSDIIAGDRAQYPADRRAEQDQADHRAIGLAQFAEIEAQPPFEQDQRDRDRHHRFEQFAEHMFGIDDVENGAADDARRQHERNGRPARAPGDPLRADPQYADQRDGKGQLLHGGHDRQTARPPSPPDIFNRSGNHRAGGRKMGRSRTGPSVFHQGCGCAGAAGAAA